MKVDVSFPDCARIRARCKDLVVETGLPPDQGGDSAALSPFDILLCSLASCTGFHVLSFLRERDCSIADAGLRMEARRSEDSHLLEAVSVEIRVPEELPDRYTDAVIRAAGKCLVKAQLGRQPEFEVSVTRG